MKIVFKKLLSLLLIISLLSPIISAKSFALSLGSTTDTYVLDELITGDNKTQFKVKTLKTSTKSADITLLVGESTDLFVNVKDSNGNPVTNAPLKWSVTPEGVVSLKQGSDTRYVTITGLSSKNSPATVTASLDGTTKSVTVEVIDKDVVAPDGTTISFSEDEYEYNEGEEFPLSGELYSPKGTNGITITWSVTDEAGVSIKTPASMLNTDANHIVFSALATGKKGGYYTVTVKTSNGASSLRSINIHEKHTWTTDLQKCVFKCKYCEKEQSVSPALGYTFGKDSFSFKNIDVGDYNISHVGNFYMQPALKIDLISMLSQGIVRLSNYIATGSSYGGACFGIAAMNASFFSNISTTDYGADNCYKLSVDVPDGLICNNNTKLKDSINIMFLSQSHLPVAAFQGVQDSFGNNLKKLVEKAKNLKTGDYPPIVNFKASFGGHAVNLIGIMPDDFLDDYYLVTVFDSNCTVFPSLFYVKKDYSSALFAKYNTKNDELDFFQVDEISYFITDKSYSIDYFAPGLKNSPMYANTKKSKLPSKTSISNNDSVLSSEDLTTVTLLINAKDAVIINDNNGFHAEINNGTIINTNKKDLFVVPLIGTTLTRITIPNGSKNYTVSSSSEFYIHAYRDQIVASVFSEIGGTSLLSFDGKIDLSCNSTSSVYEISYYDYSLLGSTDIIGLTINGKDGNVHFASNDGEVQVSNTSISDLNIIAQHGDVELSTDKIPLADCNGDTLLIKAIDDVLDVSYSQDDGKVKSVSIDNVTMNYKASTTIKPVVEADEGVTYTIKYESSNPKVASVDENGNVKALKKGNATITVTVTDEYGNVVTDTCDVSVKYAFWQWIIIIVLFGWIWY